MAYRYHGYNGRYGHCQGFGEHPGLGPFCVMSGGAGKFRGRSEHYLGDRAAWVGRLFMRLPRCFAGLGFRLIVLLLGSF